MSVASTTGVVVTPVQKSIAARAHGKSRIPPPILPVAEDSHASQWPRFLSPAHTRSCGTSLTGEQSAQQRLAHHAGADDAERGALAITDTG